MEEGQWAGRGGTRLPSSTSGPPQPGSSPDSILWGLCWLITQQD